MSGKNTEDCKNYLNECLADNFPSVYKQIQKLGVNWTRVKKFGEAPIQRIFIADNAPLKALVLEDEEGNLSGQIDVTQPWDYDLDEESDRQLWDDFSDDDMWGEGPIADLAQQVLQPQQFYYTVKESDIWGNGNLVNVAVFTPVSYFDRTGYMYDQHLPIQHLFPQCIEKAESMEGVWDAKPGHSKQDLHQKLQHAGFVYSDSFDKLVEI